MLRARSVVRSYGGRTVIDIDDLTIERGKITAIVGPNGCGKSTLLRILSFVETPSAGNLTLDEKPISTAKDRRWARSRVTLVEQKPLLFRGTVEDNLRYALSLRRTDPTKVASMVAESLDRLQALTLAKRDAPQLSEGEAQLVAVARALSLKPAVLLLDEPASAADRATIGKLYGVLQAERESGTAICLASHQLEDAYRWSDDIITLAGGRIGSTTPENLFRTIIPEKTGYTTVEAGALTLHIIAESPGPASVMIPPEDIVLSTEPLRSSARNQFCGTVIKISDDGRGHITVVADCGSDLTARITSGALEELGIGVGSQVFLSVKATAVQVF